MRQVVTACMHAVSVCVCAEKCAPSLDVWCRPTFKGLCLRGGRLLACMRLPDACLCVQCMADVCNGPAIPELPAMIGLNTACRGTRGTCSAAVNAPGPGTAQAGPLEHSHQQTFYHRSEYDQIMHRDLSSDRVHPDGYRPVIQLLKGCVGNTSSLFTVTHGQL
jgi:hypothetical protein